MSFLLCIIVALSALLVPLVLVVSIASRLGKTGKLLLVWFGAPLSATTLATALGPLIMMTLDLSQDRSLGKDFLRFISAAVVLGVPCVLAAGIGSTLYRPSIAFVGAWILTPVIEGILEIQAEGLVDFCLVNPNVHPMESTPIAFLGLATGVVSGFGALIIMGLHQRSRNGPGSSGETQRA